jgi:hypothetical protein
MGRAIRGHGKAKTGGISLSDFLGRMLEHS